MKKFANSCTGAHIAGHLTQIGVCQFAPNGPILKIYNYFFVQNPNLNGFSFKKIIANSCILGPILWAVLNN